MIFVFRAKASALLNSCFRAKLWISHKPLRSHAQAAARARLITHMQPADLVVTLCARPITIWQWCEPMGLGARVVNNPQWGELTLGGPRFVTIFHHTDRAISLGSDCCEI